MREANGLDAEERMSGGLVGVDHDKQFLKEPLQKSVLVASLRGRGRYRNRYRSLFTRYLPTFVSADSDPDSDSDPDLVTWLFVQRFLKDERDVCRCGVRRSRAQARKRRHDRLGFSRGGPANTTLVLALG